MRAEFWTYHFAGICLRSAVSRESKPLAQGNMRHCHCGNLFLNRRGAFEFLHSQDPEQKHKVSSYPTSTAQINDDGEKRYRRIRKFIWSMKICSVEEQ